MLFLDRMGPGAKLDVEDSETVDWMAWARNNGLLGNT